MSTPRPVRNAADVAAASQLARDFFEVIRGRYPEMTDLIDAYLVDQDFEGQLANFASHFNPPAGECLMVDLDGVPVGIVMLKRYSGAVCEMNRMFVSEAGRGRGLGRKLGEQLIAEARALGYREMRLDALHRHVEALPLYASLGFLPDANPPAFSRSDPNIISMRRTL